MSVAVEDLREHAAGDRAGLRTGLRQRDEALRAQPLQRVGRERRS